MKVKDCLQDIFNSMENKKANQDIFNFVDSSLLDKYYINMYGNRQVTELVKNIDRTDLEDILINKFIGKWNNIILNYLDSNNILDNYKEVITEIENHNIENQNTRVNTNKVSAYNDDDFVNSDEDTTTETNNTLNDGTKESVKTRIKDVDFYNKVNEFLTNFDIYNIMIIDINNVVTMNILN